jgi:HlyD family secretion protein
VSTESVLRRDFVQTVVASGRVEAPHRLEVGVQITGTVLRIPVTEGQAVKAGDLLLELEAAELTATGRQADVAVMQAQAKLRQLQEVQGPVAAQTLRQAQSGLKNARAALARSRDLFGQGFIGQAALDEARKTAELADAEVRAAQKQLDTTAASGSDRALALANVAGAQASAQAARARTGYAAIKAPVAGTLIARNVEVGDVVQPGKVLMTLSPQGRTQLVVAIDEKNLALLALGQQAMVSADAYPAQRFEATLAYINPSVNATTGAVEVKLDAAAPPAVLKQDMTVSVDIEVARRPQALIVPLAAVHDAETTPWVLRLEGRHAVRRSVRLGLHSGGLAEVLEGLSEGDAVLVGPAAIKPGARVRATPRAAATAASAPK